MAIQQSTCNINSSANVSVQRAIDIQKVQSGVSSSLVLNSKAVNIQKSKTNISATCTFVVKGYKTSFIASEINTNSQVVVANIKKYNTLKANLFVKSDLKCYHYFAEIRKTIEACLPYITAETKTFVKLQDIQGNELTRFYALMQDTLLQFNIDSATWGLELWENQLNIVTNSALSFEDRRKKIKERLLLNYQTIPAQRFDKIMDSYYSCDVVENFNDSKIEITILGKRGVPENINAMKLDAEELLPCHLDYEFIYTYLPWDELEQSGLTWDDLENFTWDKLETSFLI